MAQTPSRGSPHHGCPASPPLTPPTDGPSTSSSSSPWRDGRGFLFRRPVVVRVAVIAAVVLCLADWVLVEDFGFLGGVGTDPNSMVPMALVFVAGYLALTKLPAVRARNGRPHNSWRG